MLPYKRSKRIGDLLREEIAYIIMNHVKDPRLGFLTITSVDVTNDLRNARVYCSVFDKSETGKTLAVLNSAKGFIKSELGKNVNMKILPQLEFFADEAIEYGSHIEKLLQEIKEEDN